VELTLRYTTLDIGCRHKRYGYDGGILQHSVYKTRITDLKLSTTPLSNGCRNDDVIQLGPLRSQSLFQCIRFSDAYFEHILFQYFAVALVPLLSIA